MFGIFFAHYSDYHCGAEDCDGVEIVNLISQKHLGLFYFFLWLSVSSI